MTNIKTLLFTVFLIISTFGSYAFNANGKTGSLLWKISGNGLDKPSYILGTLHVKPGTYLDSIPGAVSAFDACEQVVGELSIDEMHRAQMLMNQVMMMSSDTAYSMLYADEDYEFINEQLTSYLGKGLKEMGTWKPSALNLALTMVFYQKFFSDFGQNNGLDMYIQTHAIEKGKSIAGLETAEYQLELLLNQSSIQVQADALLCNLRNLDYMHRNLAAQVDNYNRKDLNKLYDSLNDPENPCPITNEEANMLLRNRNGNWMNRIPDLMKRGSSFIAVGALHLAGEEGLLNQLEMAGYTVDAVQ